MDIWIPRLMGAIVGCTWLAACASTAPANYQGSGFAPPAQSEPDLRPDAPRRMSSATVIETSRLGRRSGNILSILGSRVANMSVRSTSGCPAITLRGQKSFVLPSNPEVYINGQRANDTCILEMTQVDDVERIEIYPMGVSGRPGYPAHPHGLILVFLRQA